MHDEPSNFDPISAEARLLQRAYWLIRLRWVAAASVAAGTYLCSQVFGIAVNQTALYCIALLLGVYNLLVLVLLNRCAKADARRACRSVKRIINVQISADLLILTVLLHFSGGIENPFVFFFIFHMIIASILLSVRDSYLHATFAVLLFGLMVLLEYTGVIAHHCLKGFIPDCTHDNKAHVLGTFFVFTITMYLVVYMATYIAVRLRRAERAYKRANDMLREKDRIKDEYVLRVTHDTKGHLAAISSCLSVAVSHTVEGLESKAEEFVATAYKRTKKLEAFVRALLKLTQMRLSGDIEMAPVVLEEAVRNAVEAAGSKAEAKSMELACDIKTPVPPILGNQLSIEETLLNLLLNAIKYTPQNGHVTVSVEDEGEQVRIDVTDDGIGIPEAEIGQVFDEFFRAGNARRIERDGTGLGLSIAKYVMEQHGGTITVQSKEGQGSTFTLVFPRHRRQDRKGTS